MNIYVGNLSHQATEDELRELFAQFGEVTSAKIIKDNFSGQSRGFAFVEMAEKSAAIEAINALHESQFKNRALTVNEAKPKTNSFGGGGNRGGGERRGGGGYGGGNRGGNRGGGDGYNRNRY